MNTPLFGYDLVDGSLVENNAEADFLRFAFAMYCGKKPEPPRHMVTSIIKHHNGEITEADAKELAFQIKYINMYFRALCRAKERALQKAQLDEPPPKKTPRPQRPHVAKTKTSEPIIPRELFEATQAKITAYVPTPSDPTEPWLTAKEIAEHLGITKETVIAWIPMKGMPGFKVGRDLRFKKSEVDAWMANSEKILTFKPLFKLLIDKRIKGKELCEMAHISAATLSKMKTDGAAVNSNVLDKICTALGCTLGDIMKMVPIDIV